MTIGTKQIENYLATEFGIVNVTKSETYKEAIKSQNKDQLFLQIAEEYFNQAKNQQSDVAAAILRGKARMILQMHSSRYDERARELIKKVVFQEALSCFNAADNHVLPQQQANLAMHAACLLDANPAIIPLATAKEQFELAATCWKKVGDLFLQHKGKISLLQFRNLEPQWAAIACYKYAALSLRNAADFSNNPTKTTKKLKDCERRELLDTAIKIAHQILHTMDDSLLNAQLHQTIAECNQLKLNIYLSRGKEKTAEAQIVQSEVYKHRKSSAMYYQKVCETNPDHAEYCLSATINFSEAAYLQSDPKKQSNLWKRASIYAGKFCTMQNSCYLRPKNGAEIVAWKIQEFETSRRKSL